MFNDIFELGNRLRKTLPFPSVFLCLITGRFVPTHPPQKPLQSQYSMLPARRAGIVEL